MLINSMSLASIALAIAVVLIVALLALRQQRERRQRHCEMELSPADADHFVRQDRRRALGGLVLVLMALGVVLGAQINVMGASRLVRRLWVSVWIGVMLLVLISLVLAWLDIRATRLYAKRHQRALADERRAFLEEERRRRAYTRNGHAGPPAGGELGN